MEFESRQWNMKFFIKDAAEMDLVSEFLFILKILCFKKI